MPAIRFFIVTLFITAAGSVYAEIPSTIAYQGILTDSSGKPADDGKHQFLFSLYAAENGDKKLWESEPESLLVRQGMFSTFLGNKTPFADSLTFNKAYYLGISVDGKNELKPRVPVTSVGYCFYALRADTAQVAKTVKGGTIYEADGFLGIGTTHPVRTLDIVGKNPMELCMRNSDAPENNRIWRFALPSNGLFSLDAMNEELTGGLSAAVATREGVWTMPKQSAVSLDNTDSFTVDSVTFTIIPFTNKLYDRQNEYSIEESRFTPKEEGDYLFCSSMYTNGIIISMELDIFINGDSGRENGFADVYEGFITTGSRVVHLKKGDFADVRIYQSSYDEMVFTPNNIWNWLTINKIN